MATAAPRAALVAGEASGDLLGGLFLQGMRQRWPQLQSVGIGGPQMARHGFEPWWSYEKLAVRGYAEVLRHYREIVGIRDALRDRLLQERPDVFIGVDAPDFNLGLEEDLKRGGIKTVHFVCPSIWAWRMKRVEKLKRACDHVLCIFPFEPELLAQHGVAGASPSHDRHRPVPSRARGLRRRPGGQRHRDAGSGPLQAAHGHLLPHALAHVRADETPAPAALGRAAEHPVPRFRGAGVAAVQR